VVPDEVGQIYIFGTGTGMAKKDAKHEQVGPFLQCGWVTIGLFMVFPRFSFCDS